VSSSSKYKYTSNYWWGTRVMITLAPSVVQEVENPTVDTGRTCSNGRSEENKHSHSKPESVGRVCASVQPICYRYKS